ncbi:AzlC family ABC transporter permease [Aquabacterium sp. CECT 9606]|uniref:AzlC family ABC transporter permease n=1 Tax=Aquabacterium sp. CECT 9606 TaxID=2845822 RepID=UPI001E2A0058|nr:AzlC family ABC transporter permease [Aquabacterium sp. CECT 9606]
MSRDTGPWGLLHTSLWRHAEFRRGAHDMGAVMPGVLAWGLVTGVAMVKAGLPLPIALLMSLSVFAASAQLAALPLMLAGAPLWVVWVTALCVNLRFVIFSAQMRVHMMSLPLRWRLVAGYLTADITYVMMMQRHGTSLPASSENPAPLAYFVGLFSVNWVAWNVASLAGVLFAGAIPTQWGLGFAGTLALVGLLVSLTNDRATALSAGLAGTAAVAAFGLPFKLNMVVAVASAVACGLLLDKVTEMHRKDGAAAGPSKGA